MSLSADHDAQHYLKLCYKDQKNLVGTWHGFMHLSMLIDFGEITVFNRQSVPMSIESIEVWLFCLFK